MKRTWLLVSLVVSLATVSALADDGYQQQLSALLTNHVLVLRGYYTDAALAYDTVGKLMTPATAGFGPTEGRVLIKKVALEPDKLTLTGARVLYVFDAERKDWTVAPTATGVTVAIALPPKEDPMAAVPKLINTVFLNKMEVAAASCSVEENKRLYDETTAQLDQAKANDATKLPEATSLDELKPYCVPGGDRAYRVGRGVTAPRGTVTPDPRYPQEVSFARVEGTTVLLVIVTPKGKPTAIAIQRSLGARLPEKVKSLGYQLDQRAIEAVSQWKFDPATFQGTPVPVAINIEVNFRLK